MISSGIKSCSEEVIMLLFPFLWRTPKGWRSLWFLVHCTLRSTSIFSGKNEKSWRAQYLERSSQKSLTCSSSPLSTFWVILLGPCPLQQGCWTLLILRERTPLRQPLKGTPVSMRLASRNADEIARGLALPHLRSLSSPQILFTLHHGVGPDWGSPDHLDQRLVVT